LNLSSEHDNKLWEEALAGYRARYGDNELPEAVERFEAHRAAYKRFVKRREARLKRRNARSVERTREWQIAACLVDLYFSKHVHGYNIDLDALCPWLSVPLTDYGKYLSNRHDMRSSELAEALPSLNRGAFQWLLTRDIGRLVRVMRLEYLAARDGLDL
jgi:hypothetical protein